MKSVLRAAGDQAGARTAACHPVQIFNDDLEATLGRMPGTVWGVTGDPVGKEVVTTLGGRPMDVPESGRVRYHAALVLAANGCAALSATAADQLRAGGVIDPAALLSGLIHASVDSALSTGQAGLSGPWVRGDGRTVAMHTEALARKQKVINVYVALARLVADRAAAAGRLDPEAGGRLWVVEMADYPYGADGKMKPAGRVRFHSRNTRTPLTWLCSRSRQSWLVLAPRSNVASRIDCSRANVRLLRKNCAIRKHIWRAACVSLPINAATEFRLLNKKCGCNRDSSEASWASAANFSARSFSSSCVRA